MCPWVGGLLGCWVGVLVGFGGVGRGWGTTMFTIVVGEHFVSVFNPADPW